MTAKDFLEKYKSCNAEIQQIEDELGRLAAEPTNLETDCVLGSPAHEPYQNLPMPISGYVQSKATTQARERLVKVYDEKLGKLYSFQAEVEKLLERVTDEKAITIIRYRYIDDLTWQQIADKLGGSSTEESTKKYCQRAIQNM